MLVRRALARGRADDSEERGPRAAAGVSREDRAAGRSLPASAVCCAQIDGDRSDRTRSRASMLEALERGRRLSGDGAQDPGRDRADGRGQPHRPPGARRPRRARSRPGVTTARARPLSPRRRSATAGAVPAFLHYRGYPATLCTSVNDVIVHGIPNEPPLRGGRHRRDRLRRALQGVLRRRRPHLRGRARSRDEAQRLLEVTREALELAVERGPAGRRGCRTSAHAVQRYVEAHGFSVVREFVGHGIGTSLHEDPQVPNFGEPGQGPEAAARAGAGDRADGQRRRRRRSRWTPTAGRRAPRTARCRRISSTRWRSPTTGARVLGIGPLI